MSTEPNPPANLPATANGQRAPTVAVGQRGIQITSLDDLWRFAGAVVAAGWAPKGMGKEAVLVAVQLGLELGLPPMSALQNIAVINGRPGIFGDAALALVRDSRLCEFFWETESDTQVHGLVEKMAVALDLGDKAGLAQIRQQIGEAKLKLKPDADDYGFSALSKRLGSPASIVSRFTVSEAKRADLWGKSVWKTYPGRMLRFRARGFNLRDNFADVLKGMRSAEELEDLPAPAQVATEPPIGRVSLRAPAVAATGTVLPLPTEEVTGGAEPEPAAPTATEGEMFA